MFPPEYEQQLRQLLRVFLEENQKLNLSAYRTEETCWIGNILDSLAFLDILPHISSQCKPLCHPEVRAAASHEGLCGTMVRGSALSLAPHHDTLTILDLGTGGGFPILPIAICLPKHHFTGIDATRKKVDAVKRIVGTLDLTNIGVFWGGAEILGKDPAHCGKYDIVLSRAVAKLPELLQLSRPFLKPGGFAVFWKSMSMDEELRDLSPISTHCYTLPNDFGQRQLLIFQKTTGTLHSSP